MAWIAPVNEMLTDPPGRAVILPCGGCAAKGSYTYGGETYACPDCQGRGQALWRACPACGDVAFDKRGQMYVCAAGCGYRWGEDHPAWLAQHWPGEAKPNAA